MPQSNVDLILPFVFWSQKCRKQSMRNKQLGAKHWSEREIWCGGVGKPLKQTYMNILLSPNVFWGKRCTLVKHPWTSTWNVLQEDIHFSISSTQLIYRYIYKIYLPYINYTSLTSLNLFLLCSSLAGNPSWLVGAILTPANLYFWGGHKSPK